MSDKQKDLPGDATMPSTFEGLPPTEKPTSIPSAAKSVFDDIEALRAAPIQSEEPLVDKILNHVPVKKPAKDWFVRTHQEHLIDALVLELKEENEIFFVNPRLQEALLGEKCVTRRRLHLGVNRQGTVFLWPLRLSEDGRNDAWARTALEAATMALRKWTRVQADMLMGGYRVALAKIDVAPVWPTESFNEILKVAFKGEAIGDLDHPVLRRLRGEV